MRGAVARGKRFPRSARVERRGVALVQSIVAEMGHIWREKSVSDVGIDGEIELVDQSNDRATGRLLMVQVKSRSSLDERSDGTIRFTCTQEDIDYWLSGTAPVVLVLVSTDASEAWFKNLQVWFGEDPARRKSRTVAFDREGDRFTAAASERLSGWGLPASSGLYLRPPPHPEVLVSNLLRVDHMSPTIHVVQSSALGWSAINARMRTAGYPTVDDVVWRGDELWSFRQFDEPPLDALANGTPERISTDELVESKSEDDQRLLVRLLNNTLREVNRDQLRFQRKHRYFYFPASPDLEPYVVKSGKRGPGRTAFERYRDKATGSRVLYYRHYALQHQFLLLDEGWHLALNPTYHYTIDGDRPSRFGAEYLKSIKRLEGHDAVRNLVKFWAGYLRTKNDLFARPDQRLRFGRLAEFDVDHGIDDQHWKPRDERLGDKTDDTFPEVAEAEQATLDLGGL